MIDGKEWRAGLVDWGWRGGLLALPSAAWAYMGGYSHPAHGAAMLSGVLVYVLLFATGGAIQTPWAAGLRDRLSAAFRQAVWLKLAWVLIGLLAGLVMTKVNVKPVWLFVPLAGGMWADLLTGIGVVQGMEQFGRWAGFATTAPADSFLWTLVTTLLQGAAVVLGLLVLTLVVLGWTWLKSQGGFLRRMMWVLE